MPGMYHKGDYDIAGFCVGVAEKSRLLDGSEVTAGDQIIALGSSGPHSNGYSLIRKVLEVNNTDTDELLNGKTIGDHLIEPTKIYVKSVLALLKDVNAHALCHITGGGFWENIPRVLPEGAKAVIDGSSKNKNTCICDMEIEKICTESTGLFCVHKTYSGSYSGYEASSSGSSLANTTHRKSLGE